MSDDYDVVVVGAGIHGAGVAQAAAAHGYRVLVIEKTTVAGGTSSRSSKLIHGGLRYLEQMELGLVRECLRERELLLRLAPEEEREYLVRVMEHYFPQVRYKERNAFAGLRVLPRDDARPFERGRELILQGDDIRKPRVLGLYGGKLTSYRADANKALRRLLPSLPLRRPVADTSRLPLTPA